MEEFGAWMAALRGDRSQRSVEREIAISHGSLSRMERGKQLIDNETLRKLCGHYGARYSVAALRMATAHHARYMERKGEACKH